MRSGRLIIRPAAKGCVLLLAWLSLPLRATADPVIYVDAHATGPVFDGSSWCSAYRQLYEALAVATAGTTIRVADGTYKPDTTGLADPRTASMTLVSGVSLEGGYAGCDAPDPDERDIELFRSTLSCDLAGDDEPRRVNRADNCSTLLFGESLPGTITVDGFNFVEANVVALRVVYMASIIRRCAFTENGQASLIPIGGAVRLYYSTSRIEQCIFQRNHARLGGAIYAFSTAAEILDCSFLENEARKSVFDYAGGAIYFEDGELRISRCSFTGNISEGSGGAIALYDLEEPDAFVCAHSTFEENVTQTDGTLYVSVVDSLVDDCLFRGNTTRTGEGAGIYSFDSTTRVRNCTIVENVAEGRALGVGLGGNWLEIRNSILWDNHSLGFPEAPTSSVQLWGVFSPIVASCIMGWTFPGDDVFTADPLFAPGPDGCHYLSQIAAGQSADSPYLDAGASNAVDLGLADRTTRSDEVTDGGVVDLGYHYPVTGRTFVRGDFDRDTSVNLADIAEFQNCFTGNSPDPAPPCCRVFDWTGVRTVTLTDWLALATAITTP